MIIINVNVNRETISQPFTVFLYNIKKNSIGPSAPSQNIIAKATCWPHSSDDDIKSKGYLIKTSKNFIYEGKKDQKCLAKASDTLFKMVIVYPKNHGSR